MAEEQKPKFWINALEEEFQMAHKFSMDEWFAKVEKVKADIQKLGAELTEAKNNGDVPEREFKGTGILFGITLGSKEGVMAGVIGGLQGVTMASLGIDQALQRSGIPVEKIKRMMKEDGFNPLRPEEDDEDE